MPPRRRIILTLAIAAALGVAIAVGVTEGLAARHGGSVPKIAGTALSRPVPSMPLLDEQGHATTLAAYRGKVVVLSPTLTLCHEVCPLTTGAFLTMEQAVRRAGLANRVVFAEISVDPWRDTPARLRAFRRYAGVDFPLLTGTLPELRRFWSFFGVAFLRTPEGKPVDVDWWTHRPETFDVAHSDGIFFVDQRSRLRIVDVGMPNVDGRLAARLRALLSSRGLRNLDHPQQAWTVQQALGDLGVLLGRRIPPPQ